MMPGFDFQALAARAHADNPDAALLDAIERDKAAHRRHDQALTACPRERRSELRQRLSEEWLENRKRLASIRPATLEGLLAKLRYAAGKAKHMGVCGEYHAALTDAIAWLEPPKPKRRRARAPTP